MARSTTTQIHPRVAFSVPDRAAPRRADGSAPADQAAADRWLALHQVIAGLVLFAAVVLLGVVVVLGSAAVRWKGELLRTGQPAQADVTAAYEGSGRDDANHVSLVVRMGFPYATTLSVGDLWRYHTGDVVDVWFDPANRDHIRTQWDASTGPWETTTQVVGVLLGGVALLAGVHLRGAWASRRLLHRAPLREVELDGWYLPRPIGGGHLPVRATIELADDPDARYDVIRSGWRPHHADQLVTGPGRRRVLWTGRRAVLLGRWRRT